jgi:hypothetical protein
MSARPTAQLDPSWPDCESVAITRGVALKGNRALLIQPGGSLKVRNWCLRAFVAAAYDVQTQEVHGPDWLDWQFINIDAGMAQPLPDPRHVQQFHLMMRRILTEQLSAGSMLLRSPAPRLAPRPAWQGCGLSLANGRCLPARRRGTYGSASMSDPTASPRAPRTNGTEPRPRLPASQRREQLLEVAGSRFAEHGYYGLSMEQLAEAAGVSKPVLYQHFPSKRELYLALVTDAVEENEENPEAET